MSNKEILEELNGYEFEERMADIFRKKDFEDVEVTGKTGDEGKDIVLEDGSGKIIVECKHTSSVGRPVLQKLHSAVSTTPDAYKGIVVTTGEYTSPAKEYAEKVGNNGGEKIELINGERLREIGSEIGLNLYNGEIEVICDESIYYPKSDGPVTKEVTEKFEGLKGFKVDFFDNISKEIVFSPTAKVKYDIDATFSTSVGVLSRQEDVGTMTVVSRGDGEYAYEGQASRIIQKSGKEKIEDNDLEDNFDDVKIERFTQTETGYKEFAEQSLISKYSEKITYTGKNNVTYHKHFEPKKSDIRIREVEPVYIPEIQAKVKTKEYEYEYFFIYSGGEKAEIASGIESCVHCGNKGHLSFCKGCGSVNCTEHTKIERYEQRPVCTECSINEKFFFKNKYFYSKDNLEQFRQEYRQMPFYKKSLENKPLTYTMAIVMISFLIILMI